MPDVLQFTDSIGEIFTPVSDTFTRTVVDGWGTADTGETYTYAFEGTTGIANLDVGAGVGTIQIVEVSSAPYALLPGTYLDADVRARVKVPVTAAGNALEWGVCLRYADISNFMLGQVSFDTGGNIDVTLTEKVTGTFTPIATVSNVTTYTPDTFVNVRVQMIGPLYRMKVWSGTEPIAWTVSGTSPTYTSGKIGKRARTFTGNTNTLPLTMTIDDFSVNPVTQIRLDLNDDVTWNLNYEGTSFDPPPLKSAFAGTLLADGEQQTASAYANRTIKLALDLTTATVDDQAVQLQKLWRELNRPTNFLKWQPVGMSQPVFFRTLRSSDNQITEYPGAGKLRSLDVRIEAEPFAHGLRETLPVVTVYNDPAEGITLNANPFFETDVSNWTATGCTFVRSTAQFHEGTASGLLTPTGVSSTHVDSEQVPVTAGGSYRASGWLYSPTGYAAGVGVRVNWFTSSHSFISTSGTTPAIAAATWTLFDNTFTAPANAAFALVLVSIAGTPTVTDILYADEVRLRQSGGAGGMCWDISGVKGDVETPLLLAVTNSGPIVPGAGPVVSAFATRRRGTPSAAPLALQCESMTLGTDTTLPGNDATMSGAGSNYARCSFATVTSLVERLSITLFPAVAGEDVRGRYRVYLRYRRSLATDAISVQLRWNSGGVINDAVALSTSYVGPGLADLGTISYPPGADPVYDGVSGLPFAARGMNLQVFAQRVSGTGNIGFDYLLLVPADDNTCYAKWSRDSSHDFQVIDGYSRTFYTLEAGALDRQISMGLDGGGFPNISPAQSNRIYVVLNARNFVSGTFATDSITDTVTITPSYWPRYLTVRSST